MDVWRIKATNIPHSVCIVLTDSFNLIDLQVGFVGYFGGRSHQPRILALATLCLSVGCFIMTLAHFSSPPYEPFKTNSASTGSVRNLCITDHSLPGMLPTASLSQLTPFTQLNCRSTFFYKLWSSADPLF